MEGKKEVLMKFGFKFSFLFESNFRITSKEDEKGDSKEKPKLSFLKYFLGLIIPISVNFLVQGFLAPN